MLENKMGNGNCGEVQKCWVKSEGRDAMHSRCQRLYYQLIGFLLSGTMNYTSYFQVRYLLQKHQRKDLRPFVVIDPKVYVHIKRLLTHMVL